MKLFRKTKGRNSRCNAIKKKFAEFGETSYTEKTRAVIKSSRWL